MELLQFVINLLIYFLYRTSINFFVFGVGIYFIFRKSKTKKQIIILDVAFSSTIAIANVIDKLVTTNPINNIVTLIILFVSILIVDIAMIYITEYMFNHKKINKKYLIFNSLIISIVLMLVIILKKEFF
ncbi:hypothetical protein [uncultured Clostridium sp.]|uniref:hypothetical protein n=1 Tax=uncultured Clostridium sp. TaxID=59620 RepID=UPI0028E2F41D|nr:hypothetical protein [uncultured Clostridium sp.]